MIINDATMRYDYKVTNKENAMNMTNTMTG